MVHYKVTYNWTYIWGEVERKEWTLYKVSDLTIEQVKVK